MPEFEIVRYHCHGKKQHRAHGCTPRAGGRMRPGPAGAKGIIPRGRTVSGRVGTGKKRR
jgi:hypothetical protein